MRARIVLTVVLLALGGLLALAIGQPVFPYDDAYITLHNAQALDAGRDTNYPDASPLTGSTSEAHLLLVALLVRVLPALWAMYVASWIGIVLYALALLELARAWEVRGAFVWLFVTLGLLVGRMPLQLLNGLETGLALAGLTFALALASERASTRPWWLLPVLCGTLPFLRPELIVVAPLLPLARAIRAWRVERERSALWSNLRRDLPLVALGALPWVTWTLAATGSPFPSTISAKRLYFAEGCLPSDIRLDWVGRSMGHFVNALGPLVLALPLLAGTWTGRAGLLFYGAFVGAYFAEFPGALEHYDLRYLYLWVPFLLLGPAWASRSPRRALRAFGALVLATSVLYAGVKFPPRWSYYMDYIAYSRDELGGLARWTRANLPKDAVLLVHDAGYISYATPFRIVDFVGLKTPSSVPYHAELTWPSCGAKRTVALAEIAHASGAPYLIVSRRWDEIFNLTGGLRDQGWSLDLLRPRGAFEVFRLRPPPVQLTKGDSHLLPFHGWVTSPSR